MRAQRAAIGLVSIVGLAAAPAAAQVLASDPASVVRALQAAGYRGEVKTNKNGKPYVSSAANGSGFSIDLYTCKDDAKATECKTLMFSSWWDPAPYIDAKLVNDYNKTSMFGRAYLNDKAELTLELPVTTVGGLNQANFEDVVNWWSQADSDLSAMVNKAREAAKPKKPGDERTIP